MKRILVFGFLAVSLCGASVPAFWEMSSFTDFLKGKFENVSLGRDGRLSPAPEMKTLFNSGQPVIWSVAAAPDGTLYAATGHGGRVYRIAAADGTATLLWTADRPEVFALALDARGVLYAASSPDGKIYRIENGKAVEYFDPKVKYIWALAVAADGTLYAGTGDGGRIFRITGAGRGEEYYATGQANVTGLVLDREGRLLAGTEPNGVLYRIRAKDQASVLYDSALPEIRAVAPQADGSIYAVALGGALAKKVQAAAGVAGAADAITTTTTSITVTAQAGGPEIKAVMPSKPAAVTATAEATVAGVVADSGAGAEKSAIYRINSDDTVETVWSSKEENVYDLLPGSGGDLYFGTDTNGRIYRLTADHKLTLAGQTSEGQTLRLLQTQAGMIAATGNLGKIYSLGAVAVRGNYESPVFDAGGAAQWGKLRMRGEKVLLRTRAGNSRRPDGTWSGWSGLAADGQIGSPGGRYLQFTAELSGAGSNLENISAAYLLKNNAPVVRSLSVVAISGAAPAITKASIATAVADTGDATVNASSGTITQTVSRAAVQQLLISWQADDPDGDKLFYQLEFRGEGEHEWKVLKKNLAETTYTIDGDSLADGRYYFKITASDLALDAELISAPVLIDNTPPVVKILSASRTALVFEAEDGASVLRRAEWSVDAGPWMPVVPVDGILDSLREQFRVVVSVGPGEHLVVVRVTDSGGNAGLAKVVLP